MFELIVCKTLISLAFGKILANPQVQMNDHYYGSGVKEADKYYYTDKPSTQYPLLKLDSAVYDAEYNRLEAGIYSVEYQQSGNSLIIKDGSGNAAEAPVFQVIKLRRGVSIPSAKVVLVKDNKVIIVYKKDGLEVHGFLFMPISEFDEK